ncbi:MAG: EAL domain-containing protein [Sulfuricurvum sp.]|nr:EAL domain-containing protein [Sulfuricurvum sp.]
MIFFRTIRGRLLTSIFFIHAVLIGFVINDLIASEYREMEKQLFRKGESIAMLLSSNAALPLQNNDLSTLKDLINSIQKVSGISMVFIIDTSGRIRASDNDGYVNQTLVDEPSRQGWIGIKTLPDDIYQMKHHDVVDTLSVIRLDGEIVGYSRVLLSDTELSHMLFALIQKGSIYALVAIILGMILAWMVIRKMTLRLSSLSEAAQQIAKKNFDIALPSKKHDDEIGLMEEGFAVMSHSLQEYIKELSEIGLMRLEQSHVYQTALLEWSKLDFDNVESSIQKATEISADTLGIERVSLWRMTPDGSMIVCDDLYDRQRDEHRCGTVLHEHDFPLYFAALQRGELIIADDAQNDPKTSEFTDVYLKPLGIVSMLDIPIIRGGKVVGVVCHEALIVHEWQPEEQDFTMAMASTMSLALEMERRQLLEEHLDYRANHDILTELPNRRLFMDRLDQAIKHAQRYERYVAILFIDLDRFKEINDSLGHLVGDQVLIHVANVMQSQLRNVDTISRLGGDEFCLMIDYVDDVQIVSRVAEKIVQIMQMPVCIDQHELYVTCSIGISVYPSDGDTPDTLLRNADAAMYKAKKEGRNSFNFYTQDMTEQAYERVALESSLRRGLEREEFCVFYQPQVDGLSDKLLGMEALIRWNHPTLGVVAPNVFVPLAIETGLIVAMDKFVMRTAMAQFARWYSDGLEPGILSLNLTIKQLKQKDFISIVESLIQETGCKREWIEFEVTENEVMDDPEETIRILKEITQMGIKLSIDDFGTGYSSLAYLKRLPVHRLKIDQSFVRELHQNEDDRAIVKAIIALSKSLNLSIIAEGVETYDQKEFLIKNGCSQIQGYFYAKPMPTEEIEVKILSL